MKEGTAEAVRDALRVRLKTSPCMIFKEMDRAGYKVEGMMVERRIHADLHNTLMKQAPMMCRNCAHMQRQEQDVVDEFTFKVKIINSLSCAKSTSFACPDGFRTTDQKWATHKITASFVSGDDEPMLTMDMQESVETQWPPTDIARSAGFTDYISPDELLEINDKSRAYKARAKTQASTPKTVDGDVW